MKRAVSRLWHFLFLQGLRLRVSMFAYALGIPPFLEAMDRASAVRDDWGRSRDLATPPRGARNPLFSVVVGPGTAQARSCLGLLAAASA